MAMAKFYQYFNRTLVASDDRMDDRAFAFGDGFLAPSAYAKVRYFCSTASHQNHAWLNYF